MNLKKTQAVADNYKSSLEQRQLTGKIIMILASLSAISTLSTNIILPAFPAIGTQFGVSSRQLGLTLSCFFITFALAQLIVGPLSDRFGRVKIVSGGLAIFLTGTIISGLSDSLNVMIVGRIIQASGVCAASVLARAISRDLFEGERLARALALTMIATATAPGFSPLVGSLITVTLGWRSIFILVGLLALAVCMFYIRVLGETHPAGRRIRRSLTGVFKAYISLFLNGAFIFPAFAVSLLMSGLFASFAAAPAILMSGMGLSPLQAGIFFFATVFVVFAAGISGPRLTHRFGAAKTTALGIFTALVGGILLLIGPQTPGLGWYAFSMIVFLWGMGLGNPAGTAIAMGPVGKEAGLASSLLGFLTMATAAATTWISSILPIPAVVALGGIQTAVCMSSLVLFLLRPENGQVE
ncbi:multidrug effflux MFS transporter [Pantoea sp. GD03673]|uniref:multidrug effflux MFS transporter n=1 Tax=Pantoea sp. GD03673 TaxID=2975364 RepID=UPI0024495F5A|nr:multidrug effflux MFS transporter [Pantoea sp. GD03673]MDH2067148.1 multidrug effflux MFS transporter [Pantoea sp. GD03673]